MQDLNISPNLAAETFEVSVHYGTKIIPMLSISESLVVARLRGSMSRANLPGMNCYIAVSHTASLARAAARVHGYAERIYTGPPNMHVSTLPSFLFCPLSLFGYVSIPSFHSSHIGPVHPVSSRFILARRIIHSLIFASIACIEMLHCNSFMPDL
ncbi:hypothetical protein C8R43DRAFT_1009495 [Mycena crocata]|nr:hypothetical protein C8R43DRAFT_1009495 [Mycena crocata]